MKQLKYFVFLLLLASCKSGSDQPKEKVNVSVKKGQTDLKSFIGKDYLIDDQHSYIGFRIKYFGYSPVRGRFNAFDGTLFYDESNISSLSVTVAIDISSINTGNDRRDDDLQREGAWFDVANHPFIVFNSTKINLKPDGTFDIIGNLTIKGTTKKITISCQKPTKISKDWAGNEQVDFKGKLILNRQDFKVVGGDFWSTVMENGLTQLSDEVEIELEIHCRKANYQTRYEEADSLNVSKIILNKFKDEGKDNSLKMIDQLFKDGKLSSGKLSTIGYTLNEWKMHDEARAVNNKRLEFFPKKISSWNQLGITELFSGNQEKARSHFEETLKSDSLNSRALEYIKLIELLNNH